MVYHDIHACHLVFRTNYLDTIAIIPNTKQSIKALQWLKYLTHNIGHRMQHARYGGDKTIGPYLVDGYYETENGKKVVLEFHGDFWHGNPRKYDRSTVNPVNDMTMGDMYDKMLVKKRALEDLGYVYVSMWESDFDRMVTEDTNMFAFNEHLDFVTPIEPRDAFGDRSLHTVGSDVG